MALNFSWSRAAVLEMIVLCFIFPVCALVLIYCCPSPKLCHLEMLFLTYFLCILKFLRVMINCHSAPPTHTHTYTQMNTCKNQ